MLAHINGTDLYWEDHGSGRPIVLLHGGPGFDHTYFRPCLDSLGNNVRVIYYDQRGTGRSSRASDALDGISFRTLVDDLEWLRAQLGLEKLILFGHSIGGCLALAYALHYGHRVDGLILCATAPSTEHLQSEWASLFDQMTPEQQAVLGRLAGPVIDDSAFRDALRTLLPLYFAGYRPEHGDAFIGRMLCSAAAWNHLVSITDEMNVYATQYHANCPTLLLNGKHDWYTNAEQVRRLRASLPNADLVELENSGHFPFIEEPERFLIATREWLASLP